MGGLALLLVVAVGWLVVLGLPVARRLLLGVAALAVMPLLPPDWWRYPGALVGALLVPSLLRGAFAVARLAVGRRQARQQDLRDVRRRRLEPLAPPEQAERPSQSAPQSEAPQASPWVGP